MRATTGIVPFTSCPFSPGTIGYNVVMAQSLSGKIANIVLPEATGGEVRLGSLWEKSRAVVVFLRHYG